MLDIKDENVEKSLKNSIKNEAATKGDNLKAEVSAKQLEDETEAAVNEMENSVAEEAETEKQEEEKTVDYTSFSLEELVATLKSALETNPAHKIKNQVESIKSTFNVKFGSLLAEKKTAFLEVGGDSIDFKFSSPIKTEYNTLLSTYKKQRDTHYKALENQLKENLEKRLKVIEDLKILIVEANADTMYKEFKQIQENWRAIGPVSKTRYNDTWKTYHHHVERFYDLLNIRNDFRDLDFKNNLEEKLKIIAKAEALIESKDINVAFKELQELHRTWKEDIGPVASEVREDIWKKFSAATKKIHDKRHEFYREMKSKYQEIINKKLVIIESIAAYETSGNKTHKDWQNSIKDIESLRQDYFNAGKLPYAKSEEVWQKFKEATKKFNNAKNTFYKEEKSNQQKNLQQKLALIEVAESLKDSEDWEVATNTLKKIQNDWKKIGHVPRKFSDDIWKKFKGACNHYFDRLNKQKTTVNAEQQAVVDAKKAFLETLKETKNHTKESVLEAIESWKKIGGLPHNVRHLEGKFNKQIDRLLESLSLDKQEVSMLKFTNVVDGLMANNDARKLDSEQLFVRKKIDEVVKEIQQLENNLGFFSNAKDNNPLVLNVKKQVADFKVDLSTWKEKLKYLKSLDY
ncbi:DUF349 domain-containing protein [uncultured Polaribacter sp.]|uniref:DUF349 domain-containing protein n=1 Tax=uncultured Polaribacter sp. TaxID=174711 RepID=UPI0026062194|nr:DUF349 domain-containing protein [uncultured Polaribacter sp.]